MQAKSTTTDRYCPNCRQMVQPRVGHTGLVWLFMSMIWIAGAGSIWAGGQILNIIMAAIVVAIIGGGIVIQLTITHTCPICKSANLSEQAPAAV